MTALFHSTFKGTVTEPSAKVVTDNETDSVFAEWVWRGVFIFPEKVLRRGFRIIAVFYSIFGCLLFVYHTVYNVPPPFALNYCN